MKYKRATAVFLCVLMLFCTSIPLCAEDGGKSRANDPVTVVLDPGHGGGEPGTCENGIIEKDANLDIATELYNILSADSRFRVFMTRTGDETVSLAERGVFANECNADILISIHIDSSTSDTASGATAYTSVIPSCSMTGLGEKLTASINKATGIGNNGVIRRFDSAGYYWNDEIKWDMKDPSLPSLSDFYGIPTWCAKFGIPSIILEHGFASNEEDSKVLSSGDGRKAVARADADAIIGFYTSHTHTYEKETVDYPSNCVFGGKASEHCVICRHRRNIKTEGHKTDAHFYETNVILEPTCTEAGKIEKVCLISANLTDRGYEVPSHSVTEETPPLGHLADESISGKCARCGKDITDGVTESGHNMVTVSLTDATCIEDGVKVAECSLCKKREETVIPAAGHQMQNSYLFAVTCTTDGAMISVCSKCGIQSREEIPASGHKFVTETVKKNSLFSSGMVREYCTGGCGTEKTETTAPLIFSPLSLVIIIAVLLLCIGAVIYIIMKKHKSSPPSSGNATPQSDDEKMPEKEAVG